MRKLTLFAAFAAATAVTVPAHAGDTEGKWQVKVMGTMVMPDGEIDKVKYVNPGLAATLAGMGVNEVDARASNNAVPTLAVEYFATPNVSIETICCITKRHVNGAADLVGTNLVNNVLIVPATITAKYHIQAGPFKPYVGVGPSMFLIMGEKPGSTAKALGVTKVNMSSEIGFALQAGFDVPLNDSGLGASLDVKRYFMDTTAKFYANGTKVLATKHTLDPWLVSAGISYRF